MKGAENKSGQQRRMSWGRQLTPDMGAARSAALLLQNKGFKMAHVEESHLGWAKRSTPMAGPHRLSE